MKIYKKPGLQANPLAGLSDLADPTVREAICRLCGHYGPVSRQDYCGTEECSIQALDYARRNPKLNAIRNLGSITVLLRHKLERYADPVVPDMYVVKPDTDGDHCEIGECKEFSRPKDLICNPHRRDLPKHRRRLPNASGLTNRIKGLGDIKLK